MQLFKTLLSLGLLATSTLALPTALVSRQDDGSDGAVCGTHSYSGNDIANAVGAGYNYLQEGETVGNDNYPHQYNDYEGFSFSTPAPWYEFPILSKGRIFDGSTSPGADRVIFDEDGDLTGVITHTGASGDDFLECSYDS